LNIKGNLIVVLKGFPLRVALCQFGDLFNTLIISTAASTFGNSITLISLSSPEVSIVKETNIFPCFLLPKN